MNENTTPHRPSIPNLGSFPRRFFWIRRRPPLLPLTNPHPPVVNHEEALLVEAAKILAKQIRQKPKSHPFYKRQYLCPCIVCVAFIVITLMVLGAIQFGIAKRLSLRPARKPTPIPTQRPTPRPIPRPTRKPTQKPTQKPSHPPSYEPTPCPTSQPTHHPSYQPSHQPSHRPSMTPSSAPTSKYRSINDFSLLTKALSIDEAILDIHEDIYINSSDGFRIPEGRTIQLISTNKKGIFCT